MTENITSFWSECLKIKAKKPVMASFNTTVRQMTEFFSDNNVSAKNDENVSVKKTSVSEEEKG